MPKLLTSVLFLIISFQLKAQQDSVEFYQDKLRSANTDSLRMDVLINLHNATFKSDPPTSYQYANDILTLGKKIKSAKGIARGYRAIARCERKKRNYKVIFHYDSLALKYAMIDGDIAVINSQQILFVHDYLDNQEYDKAYKWLVISAPVVQKLNKPDVYGQWAMSFGYYYRSVNQHKRAIPYFYKAISNFTAINDEYHVAESEMFLAQSLTSLGHTDSVASLLFKALDIYTRQNKQSRMGMINELIGDRYLSNGDAQRGLQHYRVAKELYIASNNSVDEGLASVYVARAFLFMKSYDSAFVYINRIENNFYTDFDYGEAKLQTLWGQFYSEKKEYKKAELYFEKAAAILNKHEDSDSRTENDKYWSQHFYRTKQYRKADSLMFAYTLREAKNKEPDVIAHELNTFKERNKQFDSNGIKILSLLYTPGGNELLKKSMHDSSLFKSLHVESLMELSPFSFSTVSHDSLITVENTNQLLELDTKYKVRQINDSLQLARQDVLLTQVSLKNRNNIIAAIAIIAALLAIGFFLQYKNRQRAERDKAKIQLLQNEIHHRVKNNLGIIKRFVEVAEQSGAQSLSLDSLKGRITAIELLHKNLYQNNETGRISLQDYLEQLVRIINKTLYDEEKNISINVNTPVMADIQTAEKVGLIINELITNSFKYGFKNRQSGQINIAAVPANDKQFTLTVKENGEGFNRQTAKIGYGSKLIEGLAYELNAAFKIETDNGVSFAITV